MKPRRTTAPTNIRFDDGTKWRLADLADRFGITASDIVREAVKQKLPEWETKGVILVAKKS